MASVVSDLPMLYVVRTDNDTSVIYIGDDIDLAVSLANRHDGNLYVVDVDGTETLY